MPITIRLDMMPTFSAGDLSDGCLVDAKCFGKRLQGFARRMALSNSDNHFGGQVALFEALTPRLSSFCVAIHHIVGMCPKPQMRGITTARVVTGWAIVQNKEAIGNWPVCYFPRDPMYQKNLAVYLNAAITAAAGRTKPQPAGIRASGSVNLRPKVCGVIYFGGIGTRTRTVLSFSLRCNRWGAFKRLSAIVAKNVFGCSVSLIQAFLAAISTAPFFQSRHERNKALSACGADARNSNRGIAILVRHLGAPIAEVRSRRREPSVGGISTSQLYQMVAR